MKGNKIKFRKQGSWSGAKWVVDNEKELNDYLRFLVEQKAPNFYTKKELMEFFDCKSSKKAGKDHWGKILWEITPKIEDKEVWTRITGDCEQRYSASASESLSRTVVFRGKTGDIFINFVHRRF